MFSLIIVIISIALVAALALATLYYGGSSFNKGSASAQATRLLNEGQQMLGAADLFIADRGRAPNSVTELISEGYLKTVPQGVAYTQPLGLPLLDVAHASTGWEMPAPGVLAFQTTGAVHASVCADFNRQATGVSGIRKKAHTTMGSQCFGETENALTLVVAKSGAALSAALDGASVSTAALETDADSPQWLTPPGHSGSGSGSGPSGPGVGLQITRSAQLTTFGNLTQGDAAVQRVVTLSNTGSVTAYFADTAHHDSDELSGPSDDGTGGLMEIASHTCSEVSPGQSCAVTLQYDPREPGAAFTGYAIYFRDHPDAASAEQAIKVNVFVQGFAAASGVPSTAGYCSSRSALTRCGATPEMAAARITHAVESSSFCGDGTPARRAIFLEPASASTHTVEMFSHGCNGHISTTEAVYSTVQPNSAALAGVALHVRGSPIFPSAGIGVVRAQALQLTNTTSEAMTLSLPAPSGSSVFTGALSCPNPLPAGQTCAMTISVAANTEVGAHNATFSLSWATPSSGSGQEIVPAFAFRPIPSGYCVSHGPQSYCGLSVAAAAELFRAAYDASRGSCSDGSFPPITAQVHLWGYDDYGQANVELHSSACPDFGGYPTVLVNRQARHTQASSVTMPMLGF